MSNDETPPSGYRQGFPSPEWSMNVEADPSPDGHHQYHADVFRAGNFVCRIALAGQYADRTAAEEALAVRVRQWLLDYEHRPRTVDSGFQIL